MIALESTELFRHLRAEELKVLRQVTLDRRVTAGQEIFREGEPGDGVYVVKEGSVEISGVPAFSWRVLFCSSISSSIAFTGRSLLRAPRLFAAAGFGQ